MERMIANMPQTILSVRDRLFRNISRMRFEEFLAIVAFLPMVYVTLKAYFFLSAINKLSRRYEGGVWRIAITILLFVIFITVLKRWKFFRDWLPFGFCIAIYTNLHDTIQFVNHHDIQNTLINIDQWLFGVQPCVWAEQFITPARTDVFTFFYSLFFMHGTLVAAVLYLRRRRVEFRYTMLSIVLGFYIGYSLYIIFPAAPPRFALRPMFTIKLSGAVLESTRQMVNAAAHQSRGAFPSLHSAGTLIALICAWRYQRWLFWVLLPFTVGLIASTIYLRHHYAIDLIAGAALAPIAIWVGHRADLWWDRLCARLFVPSAEGEPRRRSGGA